MELKGVYIVERHLRNALNAKREGEKEWTSVVGVFDSVEFAERFIDSLIADRLREEPNVVKTFED